MAEVGESWGWSERERERKGGGGGGGGGERYYTYNNIGKRKALYSA